MKKVFNRFDPFMPIKTTSPKTDSNIVDNETNTYFEDFSNNLLNEGLRFGTPRIKSGLTIVLTKKAIGNENGLGEKLMEDFLYSISNSFELPQYLIFMNEAVLLLGTENINEIVIKLKKYGVQNLVSVESLNHFNHNITNKSLIRATSGDITEKMIFSKHVVSL